MPEIQRWNVEVIVCTKVTRDGRGLVSFTTNGQSEGLSPRGLAAVTAPALADALADHARLVNNFRKAPK